MSTLANTADALGDARVVPHDDRVWRIARWAIAAVLVALSVALLVLGGYAVHYAKQASAANSEQQTKDTEKKILAQVSKTALLVTQSQKVIAQAQKNATSAKQQISAAEASAKNQISSAEASTRQQIASAEAVAKQTSTQVQASLAQTNQLLNELDQSQKQIAQELSSISSDLTALQKRLPQTHTTSTSTSSP